MKSLTFKILFLLLASLPLTAKAQIEPLPAWINGDDSIKYMRVDSVADREHYLQQPDKPSRYDKRIHYYRKHWDALIPTQGILQTCGNMGLVAIGLGWDYGKRSQWETQLLIGYVPKFDSHDGKMTFTLKQNYIPWSLYIDNGWSFEPLQCSIYFNTIFGHDFWTKQPVKYGSGYYPFSTRIRPNISLGERFTKVVPESRRKAIKSISFFYELGTNDIYFMRFYRNGDAGFWDVFGLSFGIKLQFL